MLQQPIDLQSWLPNHGPEQTRPHIDKVIAALKETGVTTFGATGYCYGGRYVFNVAFDNVISAAVVSHPSLLKFPDDLEVFVNDYPSSLMLTCLLEIRRQFQSPSPHEQLHH
jgi:dienelactone hydrolase